MNQDAQTEDLQAVHADLEQQLDQELQRPSPNALRIQELKREKLRIKDEIAKHV